MTAQCDPHLVAHTARWHDVLWGGGSLGQVVFVASDEHSALEYFRAELAGSAGVAAVVAAPGTRSRDGVAVHRSAAEVRPYPPRPPYPTMTAQCDLQCQPALPPGMTWT